MEANTPQPNRYLNKGGVVLPPVEALALLREKRAEHVAHVQEAREAMSMGIIGAAFDACDTWVAAFDAAIAIAEKRLTEGVA